MVKVGKKPDGPVPKCQCGCGQEVRWLRGRGWSKWVQGHHIRVKNPNKGEHMLGDQNPMRQEATLKKVSGAKHWRNRSENRERAEEYRQEQQERYRGEGNPNWQGGRTLGVDGRPMVRVNGKYVLEHRHLISEKIGRPLAPKEVVHHKNKDISDNRIENLELLKSQSVHVAQHNRDRRGIKLNRKKRKPLDLSLAPLCLCGCGEKVSESTAKRGTWNKVVRGHNAKIFKVPN